MNDLPPHWREGAKRILAQTTIPAELQARLSRDLFERDGDPRAENRAATALLSKVRWEWPEFDRWLAEFKARRKWPAMWHDIAEIVADGSDEDDDPMSAAELAQAVAAERIPLLVHTIASAVAVARDVEHMREGQADRGAARRFFRLSFIGDPGGEAERCVAKPFDKAIRAGDWSKLPPFFPGDRTGLISQRMT